MAKEPGISIRHKRYWQPMQPINLSKEQLSNMNSICGFLTWNEMHHFRKLINYNKNIVITSLHVR